MLSIRGIYDGEKIVLSKPVDFDTGTEVIVTFLVDEEVADDAKDTGALLELAGSWEDDRSAEEIIRDIYESRKSSNKLDNGL